MRKFSYIFLVFIASACFGQTQVISAVNFSGKAIAISSTLVDVNSVWTIHDDATNHAGVAITVQAEPGSPQYTYTIQNSDIPSNANITDYQVLFSASGKNTDVSNARTINWRFTLNGTDIGSGSNSQALTASGGATPFWYATGRFQAAAIAAGDIVGIKMWATASNNIDYRDVTIYIVPRKYAAPANTLILGYITPVTSALAGANSGVTYTNVASSTLGITLAYYDPNVLNTSSVAFASAFITPIIHVNGVALSDNNSASAGAVAAQRLDAITSITRYFRQWTLTIQ